MVRVLRQFSLAVFGLGVLMMFLLDSQCYTNGASMQQGLDSLTLEKLERQALLFSGKQMCGDGICNTQNGESCKTCPSDCGPCEYSTIISGCKEKNHVTLTFDDGPSDYTSKLLDTLKREKVSATFFIVGANVVSDPIAKSMLIQQAYQEGHVIGTHTFGHVGLTRGTTGGNKPSKSGYMTLKDLHKEMLMNDIVLGEALGNLYPRAFRPPYLEMNSSVLALLETMGYIPISVNVDSVDWRLGSSSKILDNIKSGSQAARDRGTGVIVLQHDTFQSSVETVPDIIRYYREIGMNIVPLSTCFRYPDSSVFYRAKESQLTNPPQPKKISNPQQPSQLSITEEGANNMRSHSSRLSPFFCNQNFAQPLSGVAWLALFLFLL